VTVTLHGLKWANLLAAATDLHAGRRDRLALDSVLLALARASETSAPNIQSGVEVPPAWLTLAIAVLANDDRILSAGIRRVAKFARRSPEHVARVTQRFLGKTPTDLVNEAKMARAVHCLSQTSDSVTEVALNCGYPNLSHFYKVFAAQFHTTPRRYRLQQQAIVRPQ
jgi:AraC family cel operon transcriptional repressor